MPKCSICQNDYKGSGNNSAPLKRKECCQQCNTSIVIPLRTFLSGTITNRALLIKPDGLLQTIKPEAELLSLKQLQAAVGGLVEIYPKHDPLFHFIVNEEGILSKLDFNELAFEIFQIKVVGNLVVIPKGLIE